MLRHVKRISIFIVGTVIVTSPPSIVAADTTIHFRNNMPPEKAEYFIGNSPKDFSVKVEINCKGPEASIEATRSVNSSSIMQINARTTYFPEIRRENTIVTQILNNKKAKNGLGFEARIVNLDMTNPPQMSEFCTDNGRARRPDEMMVQAMKQTYAKLADYTSVRKEVHGTIKPKTTTMPEFPPHQLVYSRGGSDTPSMAFSYLTYVPDGKIYHGTKVMHAAVTCNPENSSVYFSYGIIGMGEVSEGRFLDGAVHEVNWYRSNNEETVETYISYLVDGQQGDDKVPVPNTNMPVIHAKNFCDNQGHTDTVTHEQLLDMYSRLGPVLKPYVDKLNRH